MVPLARAYAARHALKSNVDPSGSGGSVKPKDGQSGGGGRLPQRPVFAQEGGARGGGAYVRRGCVLDSLEAEAGPGGCRAESASHACWSSLNAPSAAAERFLVEDEAETLVLLLDVLVRGVRRQAEHHVPVPSSTCGGSHRGVDLVRGGGVLEGG